MDPCLHLAVVSPYLLQSGPVPQSFLFVHDLDTFEGHWPTILLNVFLFGFMYYFSPDYSDVIDFWHEYKVIGCLLSASYQDVLTKGKF